MAPIYRQNEQESLEDMAMAMYDILCSHRAKFYKDAPRQSWAFLRDDLKDYLYRQAVRMDREFWLKWEDPTKYNPTSNNEQP